MQPIADFSELGSFLDMPVRYYSAGMRVRLAFSIATAIEPEILLIDEVLAARIIAWPLTLPMCAPISDGAAAALVCSADALRVRERRRAVPAAIPG